MKRYGAIILGLAIVASSAGMLLLPRIAQDPAYHDFADRRTVWGVPNLLNVISNLPFAAIGILGLLTAEKTKMARVFFLAVTATAFGSAWYHFQPDSQTLFWDRLPMAVGFMALFALVVGDRMDARAGELMSFPLIAAGIVSVVYWRLTDDLRIYALVQFFPLLAIPAMMLFFPSSHGRTRYLAAAMGCYAAAKLLEALDSQIFGLGGLVSGHTLKHFTAALATFWILRFLWGFRGQAMPVPMSSCGG
jgi:Ceramidase